MSLDRTTLLRAFAETERGTVALHCVLALLAVWLLSGAVAPQFVAVGALAAPVVHVADRRLLGRLRERVSLSAFERAVVGGLVGVTVVVLLDWFELDSAAVLSVALGGTAATAALCVGARAVTADSATGD